MLMLVLISCTSSPKRDVDSVYFPPVPDAVDSNGNLLSFNTHDGITEIPVWYWKLIMQYVIKTENAKDELGIK